MTISNMNKRRKTKHPITDTIMMISYNCSVLRGRLLVSVVKNCIHASQTKTIVDSELRKDNYFFLPRFF